MRILHKEIRSSPLTTKQMTIRDCGGETMHPTRKRRVVEELKDATPLALTVRFEVEFGDGIIKNTVVLRGMPALLFESEGRYVVKCLPLNHLGMGETKDEAFERLGEDLAEMLNDVFAESRLFDHIKGLFNGTAAKLYWDEHKKLIRLRPAKMRPKRVERRVKNVELETVTPPDLKSFAQYQKQLESVAIH